MNTIILAGQWTSDGTEANGTSAVVVQPNGSTHVQASTTGGSPLNFRLQPAAPLPSTYYLQATLLEDLSSGGSFSTGVVSPDEFAAGFKLKGMFYNGNLTNGSAALKTSFGPRPKLTGESVVIRCNQENNQVKLTVYVNGQCNGLGFQVEAAGASPFVPCITFHGKDVKLELSVSADPPAILSSPTTVNPLLGDWKITQASAEDGSSIVPSSLDPQHHVGAVLSVEQGIQVGKFHVAVKVANSLRTTSDISKQDDTTYVMGNRGGIMSTMMLGPPAAQAMEQALSTCLESSWSQLKVVQGNELIIKSITGTTLASCSRIVASVTEAACTSYKQ